jgi:hypothetical protein
MGKWMKKLQSLEGAVVGTRDVHSTVIQSASPSFNFVFGKGWGLPLGYSMILYGLPKSGKSLISYMLAGGVHKDYPNGIVIKFNTEFREGQLDDTLAKNFGVDRERYVGYDVNDPEMIYDRIEKDIAAACQDGEEVKLVIIDSMNGVQGRRDMDSESVMKQQIGDVAATNKTGLKRILGVQRKYGFSLVLCCHAAVEMDSMLQKVNGMYKNGASTGVQAHAEYFMLVERNIYKAGRVDILGKEFIDDSQKDMADRGAVTATKIKVTMKDSSMGPRGRHGEFTMSPDTGIINQHEEVFTLGTNRGVILRPNQTSYMFGDRKWVGKEAFITALRDDQPMQDAILKELRLKDLAGGFSKQDAIDADESDAAGKVTA